MSDDVPVRVSGPQFRHDYEWYEQGEELIVSEDVLEQYPNRLERIDAASGGSETGSESEVSAEELDPHPSDLTVAALETRISDVDDVEPDWANRHDDLYYGDGGRPAPADVDRDD